MRAKNVLCVLATTESKAKIWYQLNAVVDSLFIFALIVCGGSVFGPCFVIQYYLSF